MQPVLGFYDGRESELPYDMEDVLVEAGVPTLVYQQRFDRHNDANAVRKAVERAKAQGANVRMVETKEVNLLNDRAHDSTIAWMQSLL